jgi:alpha 1,2-mannosyltransferase
MSISKQVKDHRENAVILVLARNSDMNSLVDTMVMFEGAFNKEFQYPYLILNNEEFSSEFKEVISAQTQSTVEFGVTDPWEYPSWINKTHAKQCREDMQRRDIIYGGSESYRFMCRFFSGFFFRHPSILKYEYYWRVEPGTQFYCNVDEDPFRFLKENNKVYGFKTVIHEYMETIPTLWKSTKEWMSKKKIHSEKLSMLDIFLEPKGDDKKFEDSLEYNGCHFWSNFEIARVDLWNNIDYLDYFNYLDKSGGFFYERYSLIINVRWGDAPVHSLYILMRLDISQIHFFSNIGYFHGPFGECARQGQYKNRCVNCKIKENIGTNKVHSCLWRILDKQGVWYDG